MEVNAACAALPGCGGGSNQTAGATRSGVGHGLAPSRRLLRGDAPDSRPQLPASYDLLQKEVALGTPGNRPGSPPAAEAARLVETSLNRIGDQRATLRS